MTGFLLTELPLYFVFFCIAAGVGYAMLLYRKDSKLNAVSKLLKRGLFTLRFFAVSIIAFLLLAPVVKNIGSTIEPPLIVFAQDNSESLESYKNSEYLKNYGELLSATAQEYEIRDFKFGDKVNDSSAITFTDKQTDISQLIQEVQNKFYNRNIGALILASDGIYNKGQNPYYAGEALSFPIYTIALGDTSVQEDAALTGVNHNKIAFLNNEFPVQIQVSAKKMSGKSANLRVFEGEKLVHTTAVNYKTDDFFTKISFMLTADKSGVRKYTAVLDIIENEHSTQNNKRDFMVEIIDSKQKILLLADAPHPDIGAIKRAMETNANLEVNYFGIRDFTGNIADFDMVVLYQLPSVTNSASAVLQAISKQNIPTLYLLGTKSKLAEFNKLGAGVSVQHIAGSFDNAQGNLNPNFKLYELNPNLQSLLISAPPLYVPFGETTIHSGAEILAYQRIKNIQTDKPLFILNSGEINGRAKTAVILGEGLWQWAIYDYKQNNNQTLFNELINKTIQFLSIKADKDRFRVNVPKLVAENQDIKISAERYNKSYELITDSPVKFTLKDSAKVESNYLFTVSGNSYKLNLSTLRPGKYFWEAETLIDGKIEVKTGELSVAQINIESENITANHSILFALSKASGGHLFTETQLKSILDTIKQNPNIKPVSYTERKTESLLNNWWLLLLIISFLTTEWFLRKYHGTV